MPRMLPKATRCRCSLRRLDAAPRLADLDVDAAGHVRARAEQSALLAAKAFDDVAEVVAEASQCDERLVHVGDVRRQASQQPARTASQTWR
jgi:hypothetical protein